MRPLLLLLLLAVSAFAADRKPNIVLVLIDDMGQTDLGCYGSKFYETPNVDKLARAGMRFTNAYSACTVCSPTRAALLTGRSPAALHVTDWIAGHNRPFAKLKIPDWTMELPADAPTLASELHRAGYVSGHFGKWHLGPAPATTHGFDVTVADNGKGQPASFFPPYKNEHLTDGPASEHLSDRLTTEAIKFIEQNKEKPFFVYLPHYAVHNPIAGKPEVIAKYKAKADPAAPQRNPTYAALVETTDDSVGRLRAKLDELKLSDNTIFIYTSDNGGLIPNTTNLNLRAGKGSAYEGGVRVPLIVSWPGVTKPGSETKVPAISYDFLPTLLEAAGLAPSGPVEGKSLLPVLKGGTLPQRALFWHYPHYHPGGATPYSAIRDGDWKLIQFFEDLHTEVYHLGEDPMEAHDLAATEPARASALLLKLDAWRKEVGAQLPTANPDYNPVKNAPKPKKSRPEP